MKRIIVGLFVCVIAVAAGCSSSSTSGGSNAASGSPSGGGGASAKIQGKWEAAGKSDMPAGSSIEFGADGKLTFHMDVNGKQMSLPAGSYSVSGDKVTLKKDGPKPEEEVNTIKSISDDGLILVDPKGKEESFKRVK